ncbi:PucR family transcriptional regulator [Microbacterium hibisci]|uniref:PucR family transcriptional regulator n=1 Tax=Microbacterium hibisci TaxID=2036000 RepID=UPI001943327A|nr:helix-turn-helix domain-containing protein [Microbacterium hibisci]
MAANLQELVEGLADRLDRSVAIDDARLHLLAHSPHRGQVDAARAESILRRAVSKEVVDHVYACADAAGERYVVTPRPELGLDDVRIGFPIRHHGALMGFLWLLGPEGDVDEENTDAATRSAAEAAVILHREHLRSATARAREQDLVERLLGGDDSARADAATAIREDGLFTASTYCVVVVDVERPGERTTDDDALAISEAVAAVRSRRGSRGVLSLQRRDHAVLIVAEPLASGAREQLLAVGRSLREAVLAKTDAPHCRVGISRSRSDLAQARRGADEAARAARIAGRVPTVEEVTGVEALGVYELLDQVPDDALRAMVHPGLLSLMSQGARTDSLVHTLEVFLDSAGDVKTASERLFAHRTSLYYRLRRIQELTGLDLSDGDDRLIAHLGLRIARLTGIHED